MVDQMTLAFDLIEQGFAVFPVNPQTKQPFTTHGHLDATHNVELVATWFSLDYPQAVVGVHAGASGLVIPCPFDHVVKLAVLLVLNLTRWLGRCHHVCNRASGWKVKLS